MTKPTAQEIQDIRDQPKIDAAYDKALTNTEAAPKKKPAPKKYAHGGSVSHGDGIAQRGKTKGRYV